ncbi:hypothetical protein E2562_012323 [Oryza meyeriana var. granulata]|uniref:Uncharacterized protein n=1 Tax=Oryza meyeriana var. granulata TaxID=110450 RepID=A0A6G1DGW8_9ORYZ|nr:hypothetical protein E2562_012323 [Oryza meyeriana var. granulata]
MASSVRDSTAAVSDGGVASPAPPEAAAAWRGSATISVTVVLLVLLVASVAAFLTSPQPGGGKPRVEEGEGGGRGEGPKGAEPVEQAVAHDAAAIPGFNSRLDAFRAWAKLTWMKLRRPHSDEPGRFDAAGSSGLAADAAKKSLEMTKDTVEQAAVTAARAAEDAVGKASDKVKGAATPAQRPPSDAEL